jgi:hypothetical protein
MFIVDVARRTGVKGCFISKVVSFPRLLHLLGCDKGRVGQVSMYFAWSLVVWWYRDLAAGSCFIGAIVVSQLFQRRCTRLEAGYHLLAAVGSGHFGSIVTSKAVAVVSVERRPGV